MTGTVCSSCGNPVSVAFNGTLRTHLSSGRRNGLRTEKTRCSGSYTTVYTIPEKLR